MHHTPREHEFTGHEDLGELFPDEEVVLPCPALVRGAFELAAAHASKHF